jgi:hypothetical protein
MLFDIFSRNFKYNFVNHIKQKASMVGAKKLYFVENERFLEILDER